VKWLFFAAVFASLSGCAAVAPLDEAERARIRVVAPAAARFPPNVEFNIPPGKIKGAATAGAGAAAAVAYLCLITGPYCPGYLLIAPATIGASIAFGAAAMPSNEGLEAMIERARKHLGAPDVQQLLMQRFSERVARLTPHQVVPSASNHGPQSPAEMPNYSGVAAGAETLVAEVAVLAVGATLAEPIEFFGGDYANRPLRVVLSGRMRLIRPSDGATLMTRQYLVARYARRIREYQEDGTLLVRAMAGAVDEIATQMVDDAFLLRPDVVGVGGVHRPVVTALEPLPRGVCLATGFDCWAFFQVRPLETISPTFRWKPFPEPEHLATTPGLRGARNVVYDLWVFGGDDDRVVEGLKTTEHALERPLTPCMRYSWAVRARFDTDAGPRTVEWSTASAMHGSAFGTALRPTFGAPFITPCPATAGGPAPNK
jgi:hypothetical protein